MAFSGCLSAPPPRWGLDFEAPAAPRTKKRLDKLAS